MEIEKLKKILEIVEKKVSMDLEWKGMDPDAFLAFDWLIWEVEEAKIEYTVKKKVYLEDELCDIIWSAFRIIEVLDREKSIDKYRIFERVIKKYSERVYWLDEWKTWHEIKEKQKKELKEEQEKVENILKN